MAAAGDPLPSRTLACLFSAQSVQGTAVTPATSPGLVDFSLGIENDLRSVFSIGAPNAKFLKPGINSCTWQVNNRGVQTKAILQRAVRSSGIVPWTTWGFGYDDDASTQFAYQIQDCKTGGIDVALDADGMLTAQLSGIGGLITELSSFTQAHLSETPMMAYEAILTRGGSAYAVRNFRFTVNHNLQADPMIRGAAAGSFPRGWSYLTEGNEEITGEITRFAKSGVNLQAATVAGSDIVLTCTDAAGGCAPTTIAITLAGTKFGSEVFAGEVGGIATFSQPFTALTWSIA